MVGDTMSPGQVGQDRGHTVMGEEVRKRGKEKRG